MFTISLFLATMALASDPDTARVVSVYDGDTLTLNTGDKVRLRWVNTPELRPMEPYGIEAREAAIDLVLGKEVELIYGPTKRDGYGRLLAGIRVDGVDLSESLIEQGLGHLFIIPPDDIDLTVLTTAQNHARASTRGIWTTDRYSGELHITSFHANAPGDDRMNVNGEYLRICNVSSQPIDITGYSIKNLSGRKMELPAMIIPVGHTFELHSGIGVNQLDPAQQLEVYLGSTQPIWNNTRDRATLFDRYDQAVDSREHEPQG